MSYCLNPACQTPNNPSSAQRYLSCGTKLLLKDRYRLLKLLGQGGCGRTFLAEDLNQLSRPRCVVEQFLPRTQAIHSDEAATRFCRKAAQLSRLGGHPQIPDLLAYIESDDQLYIVQSFIEGDNLTQKLSQGVFSEVQVRLLLSQLLSVLSFIHAHHVMHRDIKPENIIQPSTGPYVLVDFGAVKGVTCLYVLTNLPPFNLFDLSEGAWAWRDYLHQPISPVLAAILDKLVSQGTKRRYQSAAEALRDLQALPEQAPQRLRTAIGNPPSPIRPSSPPKVECLNRSEPSIAKPAKQEQFCLNPHLVKSDSVRSRSATGMCLRTLEGHSKPVQAVAY